MASVAQSSRHGNHDWDWDWDWARGWNAVEAEMRVSRVTKRVGVRSV